VTVCPVCEHAQEVGFECEVCGKDLSGPLEGLGPPPISIEAVPEFEVTTYAPVGDVPTEGFGDLEANAFAKTADAPVNSTPDLETSALPPAGEVAVDRVPDISEDRVADDGQRTAALSGQVTCRYCKNVQPLGTVCDRCGMKLPTPLATDLEKPVVALVRCRACGAPGPVGERCKECGRVVSEPDA
jgi:hypothetical protein